MKTVSVIITTYNSSTKAIKSIYSILGQTSKNYEIIVVDDCSNVNEYDLLSKSSISEKYKLIRLDENTGGPSIPRNIGVANSKGDYIAFLDAGDIWLENKLQEHNNLINLGYPYIFSDYYISNYKKKIPIISKNIISKNDIEKKCYIGSPTALIKKNFFTEFKNIKHEDYNFWLNSLKHFPIIKETTEPLAIHYRDKSSRSSNLIKNIYGVYFAYKNSSAKYIYFKIFRYVMLGMLTRLYVYIRLL